MIIEFKRPYGAYAIGDRAGFAPDMARAIIAKGAAVAHVNDAPQSVAPEVASELQEPALKRAYRKRGK